MDNSSLPEAACQELDKFSKSEFLTALKAGVWLLGVASWLFGITDRSIATFSDGYLSASDITQLLTASFFFVSWLLLKPAQLLVGPKSSS